MSTAAPSHPTRPWRLLIASARRPGGGLGWVALALLIATVLPLLGPLVIARFVDQATSRVDLDDVVATGALYLAIAIGAQVAAVAVTYTGSRWAWTTTNALRDDLAAHALGLDYAFHGRHTAGEMIERVDGDIVGLTDFLSQFVLQAATGLLLLTGTLVVVSVEDLRLGLAFATLVLVGGAVIGVGQRRVTHLAADQREAFAQFYGGIEEHIAGAEDIRANAAGHHVMRRFFEDATAVFRADLRWNQWGGLVLGIGNLVFAFGTVAMLAVGVVLHRREAITLGTVVALFQYSQLVRAPVEQIVGQAKQLQEAAARTGRVAQLLSEQRTITDPPEPVPLPTGALGLRLRGVTFAYGGDPPVLHEVDLVVEPGRSLGLVGRTGSGKTTIGRLALRLYDTTTGAIELGGVDVREAAVADVRRRVRAVSQEVQLFNASLADNVTLFDASVDHARIVAALDGVGLGPWFASLPDGLATSLGPNGVGMSAGEAQLLALSRLFLADPSVVVLDEPSSRLDPATARLVEAATTKLLAGRTSLVIAHRAAALAQVDDIAVLEHGRVVEHGPRAVLLGDPTSRASRLLNGVEADA